MTQELALAALFKAVYDRLTADPGEVWGDRVFPDRAVDGTAKPLVIFWWLGGGELNSVVRPDAEIVLGVKVVAPTQAQAFALAGRLSALLNDADRGSDQALDGGDAWLILHTMQEGAIHLVEDVDGSWIYHDGFRLRVRMEATN